MKTLSILLSLSLVACGGAGGSAGIDQPTQPTPGTVGWTGQSAHPIYGALSANEIGLLGPDLDGNGIRDDVDLYISKNFSGGALIHKAVSTYAFNATLALIRPKYIMSANEASKNLAVYFCASSQIEKINLPDADNWNNQIIATTLNTPERMRAWTQWDALQESVTSLDLEQDPCVTSGF
jgi:hypothetical protein